MQFLSLSNRRLFMYLLYTVAAVGVYYMVFTVYRADAPLICLGIVLALLFKDTVLDMFLLRNQPILYEYIEHAPFNYVLVLYLVFMADLNGTILGFAFNDIHLTGLALVDLVIDFNQDARV